jgi:hypothetical protein
MSSYRVHAHVSVGFSRAQEETPHGVPPSHILYTKEILKNTKDLRQTRISTFTIKQHQLGLKQ